MNRPDQNYFPFLASTDELSEACTTIRNRIDEYIRKYRLKSLVLGISGGIDSTLCAALLHPVCKNNHIPLVGRSITIESNKPDEIERSVQVGHNFCDDFEHVDLTALFLENKKRLITEDDSLLTKLRQGNMKARMRMMMLYDLAQLHGGIVISTDNYTEFLTGFWTLHGDVGDYAPILNLWKTEVYNLSAFLLDECSEAQKAALNSCIEAVPVDGLGISSCDCEQLGVNDYFEADTLFASYFNGNSSLSGHQLIKRYLSSSYKRENPISIKRNELIKRFRS